MDKEQKLPEVIEAYNDYSPSVDVKKIVLRLLRTVPDKYLIGLDVIVLKNSSGMPRKERRQKTLSRKKSVKLSEAGGYYQQKWKNRNASIVLLVDNISEGMLPRILMVPFFWDMLFGEILYHEIGHHIHHTVKPEYNEREDIADKWGDKLLTHHARKHYWYFVILLSPFSLLRSIIRKIAMLIRREA